MFHEPCGKFISLHFFLQRLHVITINKKMFTSILYDSLLNIPTRKIKANL